MEIFVIGQSVKVTSKRDKIGIVSMVQSWRDCVLGMDNQEAKLFSSEVSARYGLDYRKIWQRVFVTLNSGGHLWVENRDLQLLKEKKYGYK